MLISQKKGKGRPHGNGKRGVGTGDNDFKEVLQPRWLKSLDNGERGGEIQSTTVGGLKEEDWGVHLKGEESSPPIKGVGGGLGTSL